MAPCVGITIRFFVDRETDPTQPANFTAMFFELCEVGTYSVRGTGFPPCAPCPAGRYGSTLGLESPACTGPCSASPRSRREVLAAVDTVLVCSQGAVSALGVSTVTSPHQGYSRHSLDIDPRSIQNANGFTIGNVAVARMDGDPFADLVYGQAWYKSNNLSPPSFTPRMFCQSGPDGDVTFPSNVRVHPVDSKCPGIHHLWA